MEGVDNILRILEQTKKFIENDNVNELKSLSNQTIHTAAVSQDADNIIVAVLVYSFGKVMERSHYRNMEGWDAFKTVVLKNLDLAIKALNSNNVDDARTYLGRIRNSLNRISGNLSLYIKDVFRKAEINKAFRLYEHGISTEKTAELLGVSLWDLSTYIGQSSVSEAHIAVTMPIEKRVKMAEEFFG